jgi:hypothetical protein
MARWKVEGDFIFFCYSGAKKTKKVFWGECSRKWGKTFKEMGWNVQGNGVKRPRKFFPSG